MTSYELLSNAIESLKVAMSNGKFDISNQIDQQPPRIWISTRLTKQNQLEIRIRDNGVGISEDTKAKIFDHFFGNLESHQRTGLGLAITLQIITGKHQGTMKVNTAIDQGAEFIIYLPLKIKV